MGHPPRYRGPPDGRSDPSEVTLSEAEATPVGVCQNGPTYADAPPGRTRRAPLTAAAPSRAAGHEGADALYNRPSVRSHAASPARRRVPGAPQGVPAIDLMFLIERLDALIEQGRRVPMTNSVAVDKVAARDLIDQLRVSVPEEVRQAKRINEETARLIERAQEEAERILARAQEQAAMLIEERELTRAAELRSQQIIEEGQQEAEEIRQGADSYAANVLIKLEGECVKALQSIRRGLAALDERYPHDGSAGPEPLATAGEDRIDAQP